MKSVIPIVSAPSGSAPKRRRLMRIDLENRTNLETVIPLAVPFIVNVDPSDSCNFACGFCPTGDRALMRESGRPLKVMPLDVFEKINSDIAKFPNPIRVLRLYKDGEPLLNKNFEKFVELARQNKNIQRIDTTTNASLLTRERSRRLIEAGIDRINISIEGVSEEDYLKFAKAKIDFEKLRDEIRYLYENRGNCEIVVKINQDAVDRSKAEKFLNLFEPISDSAYTEHIMSCWPNFDLRDELSVNEEFGIYGQEIKEVDVCPYVFYSFSVNSDGTVSACFLDWSRDLVVGDTRSEDLLSIWSGPRMNNLRKMFLKGNRKSHRTCGNCGQMTHGAPDNIDAHKDALLQRFETI